MKDTHFQLSIKHLSIKHVQNASYCSLRFYPLHQIEVNRQVHVMTN